MSFEEFTRHKIFWEKFRYGVTDDMLALVVQQLISTRTGNKPLSPVWGFKESALDQSGAYTKRIKTTVTDIDRQRWLMMGKPK